MEYEEIMGCKLNALETKLQQGLDFLRGELARNPKGFKGIKRIQDVMDLARTSMAAYEKWVNDNYEGLGFARWQADAAIKKSQSGPRSYLLFIDELIQKKVETINSAKDIRAAQEEAEKYGIW